MCFIGNDEVVEVFIVKGVDINKIDKFGKIVLMVVFMNGYFNLVCLFVDKGVDVFEKNREGKIVLEFVRLMDRYRIIKYFEF